MRISQRAEHLFQTNRPEMAIELLQDHLALDPDDADAHGALSRYYCQIDKNKEAHHFADNAIALEPDDYFGYLMKARIYRDQLKWNKALKFADEAYRLCKYDASIPALRCTLLHVKGEVEEAIEAADQGLSSYPNSISCLTAKAEVYLEERKFELAEEVNARLLELRPDSANCHVRQGKIHLRRGESEEACGHFADALRIDASNKNARSGYLESLKAKRLFFYWPIALLRWLRNSIPGLGMVLVILSGPVLAVLSQVIEDFFWVLLAGIVVILIYLVTLAPLGFLATSWFDFALLLTPEGGMVLGRNDRGRLHWFGLGLAWAVLGLGLMFAVKPAYVVILTAGLVNQLPAIVGHRFHDDFLAKPMIALSAAANFVMLIGLIWELTNPSFAAGSGLDMVAFAAAVCFVASWLFLSKRAIRS